MEDLQYLAAWVKEQHAREYILTWLLSQQGLWWSDGEIYQAVLQKSGKLLKAYVQKRQAGELFEGISEKLVGDENWDDLVISLGRIVAVYQEELVKLQERDMRGDGLKKKSISQPVSGDSLSVLEVQQALPDPYADTLTGR
ncbi:MAG: hypothetical protein JGK24_17960 [Microcoleus sp. PH2017_29_MFU_D_A]|jgi:hypothetical protein|uniref:hypothetical protein n=1 Tax=unclassified Microcoleus TaxID=2642155 RepID=UPI001D37998B|nr:MULTISPECIES: hypothetical protein [unclassified Microcoleus]MCC3420270.1 hypothetical protein [Microcoleus sp. PH2017_07_MST_O_A]MCC3432525.1 hypothetical protein [Microcoleus sp. PH2017_04_SCI_O_A]MCC3443275.1 hypothetical protein [Microcoleus sp. PH2017_03_ELD_O_A]MCC3466085.1 hypothetical protein [Microcoleus sp. PH2017_06_SFM_O_A]MCC3503515.1 hypothetical protein [Microcoleus sp. PH2017_19_SFW_U_A]MCC3510346.1 hypothetical protein [Microcoleus sp. PH2017_17_BER_D_A]TAE14677.1 MAG: hy